MPKQSSGGKGVEGRARETIKGVKMRRNRRGDERGGGDLTCVRSMRMRGEGGARRGVEMGRNRGS